MAVINLNNTFPIAADGSRGPLPKQSEFLRSVLQPVDKGGPKYVAYVGGIGSGKSLIGCITMLSMAIQTAGDYLICRQFMPELKVTTLKTFLEICPKELILEYRVADNYVKLKAVNGTSTIYFRQLEEPDKYRSMNLSGFLIDEANQVSEEAFLLLQGRLRGPGLRKGLIVSNPAGHDWLYRFFKQKSIFKTEQAKTLYYLIEAPSTENVHLPEGYISSLMATWSDDRIKREIYGSFDAFEGMVYHEFRRDVHVIKPFRIPDEYPKFIGIDHGYRNPSAWVWCAIGPDGEVYVYREFYQAEWLIAEIVKGKKDVGSGVMELTPKNEKIQQAFIDPSTKNRRGTTGESDYDEYIRVLPDSFPMFLAQNDVQVGIDRVKSYLKVHPKSGKPNLYIFDTCINLLEEITQYKYPELKPSQEGRVSEKEKPLKVNDHALDALRYVLITLPEPYVAKDDYLEKVKYNSLERSLAKELRDIRAPKQKDPFGF